MVDRFRFWINLLIFFADGIDHDDQLFKSNLFVNEIETPLKLKQYMDEVGSGSSCLSDVSRMTILYSHWCPHCHTFAPIWSALGEALSCQSRLSLSAFECTSEEALRFTPSSQWLATFGKEFPKKLQMISPQEICGSILEEYYPTIMLTTPKS